ncbi:HD-GYP domain-containing protein [Clostridium brassicae]|uniref:HD domain-containing protein n=1 Tax=Clostridium brassicae TaxID=2999072 RepID=A0ABT4D4A6_9CLOT|nr:HD domain-containing phosphohydrolase [Clostridium brassicae]MCY6957102.1 HD domain-containing protein [Clostridium brassicae]
MERTYFNEIPSFHVFNAFSMALDIAECKSINHAKRIAYISIRLARALNLTEDKIKNVYYAAALHDIGINNYNRSDILDKKTNWIVHCKKGEHILKRMNLPEEVYIAIKYHHERWDGKGPFELYRNNIPIISQIVSLADEFDSIFDERIDYIKAKYIFTEAIIKNKNKRVSSEVIDGFLKISEGERFWLDCKFNNFDYILNKILPKDMLNINLESLENISEVFAGIIDSKSKFTHNHSRGIANKMYCVTNILGYNQVVQKKAYIAGLLHDLGKIAVPNSILNKNGKLNTYERGIIDTHPYYTRLILEQIPGIEDITSWASNHHERVDGKGYPQRLLGCELGDIDKLMCVCDVYQALTEDRPYRKGMEASKAWNIVNDMIIDGALCPLATKKVRLALE